MPGTDSNDRDTSVQSAVEAVARLKAIAAGALLSETYGSEWCFDQAAQFRADLRAASEGDWPEAWSGPCTVGNMIANLRTLPPETPLYSAYHISRTGAPSLLRVQRPTLSRERVDGITIKTGDESVPYSAVIWSHPKEPLSAPSDQEKMADLLTKAVGDIAAALTMAGKQAAVAAWTKPYVDALNEFDTRLRTAGEGANA